MSHHHWFRPFCAVSQHHVSMAELIQQQLQNIIFELDDNTAWIPGRLDDCLNMIRPLFDAEEILMIQSHYPDYYFQKNAHGCFMRTMSKFRKSGQFMESEQYAATWLHVHESVSGTMFHHYLQNRAGNKKDPEEIMLMELNPDYIVLPMKIVNGDSSFNR
ncbi:MAG: hypothetical protein IKB16_07585 [Lentisphaeria bacterium]|nr:hypothetical protein [Lentisphaeria bacterium]